MKAYRIINIVFYSTIAFAIGFGCGESLHTFAQTKESKVDTEAYLEDNGPWSGMFFSTENVVEEYESDGFFCIKYDDADANMFNVEIPVDYRTYEMCIEAWKTGEHQTGELWANMFYSHGGKTVYSFEEPYETRIIVEKASNK